MKRKRKKDRVVVLTTATRCELAGYLSWKLTVVEPSQAWECQWLVQNPSNLNLNFNAATQRSRPTLQYQKTVKEVRPSSPKIL